MMDKPHLAASEAEQALWLNNRWLDLTAVIQSALIYALEKSAKVNGYVCRDDHDPGCDGWYTFKGAIDTRYIAEAVADIAKKKIARDRRRKHRRKAK